jgi:protein-S-isoprenylcysteine O-methyltransferase Ste14
MGGMFMKSNSKMLIGYIVGGLLVLVIMPSIVYVIAIMFNSIFLVILFQNDIIRYCISIVLVFLGLFFGLWSIIVQNRIGKGGPLEIGNIEISPKTKNLVISGPYKFTRNPMLFGTFMAYLGYAVFLNSLTPIITVCLLIVFMLLIVVQKEEKRLYSDFGGSYDEYRKKTALFIPWMKK